MGHLSDRDRNAILKYVNGILTYCQRLERLGSPPKPEVAEQIRELVLQYIPESDRERLFASGAISDPAYSLQYLFQLYDDDEPVMPYQRWAKGATVKVKALEVGDIVQMAHHGEKWILIEKHSDTYWEFSHIGYERKEQWTPEIGPFETTYLGSDLELASRKRAGVPF